MEIDGYPACAGIDLIPDGMLDGDTRLPRMRGDRPQCESDDDAEEWATPHARGSTCYPGLLGRAHLGYPACAGIDLAWS